MKNPPQHKDFDTVVYKLLDATRKAFRKEQHGEAKQYLAEAMQAADRFARYLHTVDGPEVAQKFRQDLKRPVARVAQIMEQHGGRLDGFDVEKLGKTCPHDGVKIGELCKCGALMKHQSLAQQADQQLAKTIARFEAGPTAREKFQYRAGQLKRLLELRKGELEKAKIISFKDRKVLADLPSDPPSDRRAAVSAGSDGVSAKIEPGVTDRLKSTAPKKKQPTTRNGELNFPDPASLPHPDYESQLKFAHQVHGELFDYKGDLGSRGRGGTRHWKAKDHLESALHSLDMARSRPADQHELAASDLVDAYENLHLAREKAKKPDTKTPIKKSESLDKAKIIDLKSRKVLADLPSPDAGDKPPHGDLTIQDVRGYPAEQNALRHHLKHMAEHYHSWQNYEGAAAAVSNPVHKKRNLAQAEKHKLAHQTHLNWARGEHSRLKGLPPVHVMERNALEQQEYKSGAMVDKFTPHPDDKKPRPKLVKSETLDKAKIYSFESKRLVAEQPGRPTARRAEKVVADGSQKVAGQIVPGNQRDEDRASGRTPKNLGVIAGHEGTARHPPGP
jgi:hypothetical protein